MVVLPRVIAIYLLASLADLLDHEELRLGLEDAFDLRFFVSWDHDEVVPLRHDRCVTARRDRSRRTSWRSWTMKGQATARRPQKV